jgi:hypothetical protein
MICSWQKCTGPCVGVLCIRKRARGWYLEAACWAAADATVTAAAAVAAPGCVPGGWGVAEAV